MDNALCGGAGSTLSGNALAAVKAAIFMGDPHNVAGLPYNVGTCTAGGVSNFKRCNSEYRRVVLT
jgi:acetylxylan esterase